jgi:succinate dehydrogenase hydrophobic anchor subunit
MASNIILDIYRLKIKIFFGSFRASKISLALLALYALGLLPSVFGFSLMITSAVNQENANIDMYIENLAAIVSGFISIILLLTLRGYTAFEYEQSLIFTSPITPRKFLFASLFADLTESLPFTHPIFILFGAVAYSLSMRPLSALTMLFIIILFIFMLLFLKISLSIINSLYKKPWLRAMLLILIVLSLLPALAGLYADFPLKYNLLPHPSTFLARSLINIVYENGLQLLDSIGLFSYFIFSLALFMFVSGKNFFQHVTYIPFISPFDASMRAQTLKMERTIKTFSRMGLIFTLNVESKSLLGFLMKKEMIRMLRDGSLFSVIFLYAILIVVMSFTSVSGSQGKEAPAPIFLMFFMGTYSLITPLMLISNWRFSDFENIWIPLTSNLDPRTFTKALLYDLIIIASLVPAVMSLILSVISGVSILLPLILIVSTSIIGSSTNLYLMIRFSGKRRRSTPSFLIGWASMLLSGLLLIPTYILILLGMHLKIDDAINALISIPMLAYSIFIMKYFLKKTGENIVNMEV